MIKVKLSLFSENWSTFEDNDLKIAFIGYIGMADNLVLSAKDLSVILEEVSFKEKELCSYMYEDFLPNADGNFAIIIESDDKLFVACDYIRSYPLFIINQSEVCIVTDHISKVPFQKENDELAQEEFLLTGLVTGNGTVFKNVSGIQAGEFAIITTHNIVFKRYYILKPKPNGIFETKSKELVYSEIDSHLISAFRRMINSCPDIGNWVVPLSGGHDSRIILNYLHRLGCSNIICFTYGTDSKFNEVQISKEVAAVFGYDWYFVEYNTDEWGKVHTDGTFDDYIRFSFNGCSVPHPLDFLAVYNLKERGVLKENDVFLPGHTGFLEAATEEMKSITSIDESLKYVYNRFYSLYKCNNQYYKFRPRLNKMLQDSNQTINGFPESFNWHERQAKYIMNSVRVYEFFGYRWRLPLTERSIIQYWQELDYDDRIERKILFSACKEHLFHEKLKEVKIINKFNKNKIEAKRPPKIMPELVISYLVRILDRKPYLPVGHNLVFAKKARTVYKIVKPIKIYPKRLRRYFFSILPRRPYQVYVISLIALYSLRNEVFQKK